MVPDKFRIPRKLPGPGVVGQRAASDLPFSLCREINSIWPFPCRSRGGEPINQTSPSCFVTRDDKKKICRYFEPSRNLVGESKASTLK